MEFFASLCQCIITTIRSEKSDPLCVRITLLGTKLFSLFWFYAAECECGYKKTLMAVEYPQSMVPLYSLEPVNA